MVGKTKSQNTSTEVDSSFQPIRLDVVDNKDPIGVPEEFANCIVTYANTESFEAGFKKCK